MPESLARLEFSLDDKVQGRPITPATVDLPTLRGFLAEVEKLIKGDEPGASLSDSRVSIETGSLKVVAFVGTMLAASLQTDLAKLEETGDLDEVQPARADVLETWQNRVRKHPDRHYSVEGATGTTDATPRLDVSRETLLERRGENAWVAVEKYVTGKVIDMGGKQTPNVHVQVEGTDQVLTVAATESQLAGEPHLYQEVTLRIAAEQHLEKKTLRKARLLAFLPVSREVDEGALARLWEKGRSAWQDIASATAWVEEMRGH